MTYEDLIEEAYGIGLKVKEKPLQGNLGRLHGKRIAVSTRIATSAEKACVLAEELGHYYTTVGNILDQKDTKNRKQELVARAWAYQKAVPLQKIIDAYMFGVSNRYEMSEYLNVPEEFLQNALVYYNGKYGISHKVGNYDIYFEPLAVVQYFK